MLEYRFLIHQESLLEYPYRGYLAEIPGAVDLTWHVHVRFHQWGIPNFLVGLVYGKSWKIPSINGWTLEVPSGKRLHNYGKSPCKWVNPLFRKWAMFNSYVTVITRGYIIGIKKKKKLYHVAMWDISDIIYLYYYSYCLYLISCHVGSCGYWYDEGCSQWHAEHKVKKVMKIHLVSGCIMMNHNYIILYIYIYYIYYIYILYTKYIIYLYIYYIIICM